MNKPKIKTEQDKIISIYDKLIDEKDNAIQNLRKEKERLESLFFTKHSIQNQVYTHPIIVHFISEVKNINNPYICDED